MRRRLDVELVRRGIAASRTEAALAIRSGKVEVSGRPAIKAGTLVMPGDPIALTAPPRPFVSRGGEKLDAALGRFAVSVSERRALDAGASTGGFTDCLLSRGAAHVIAIDVGYGQLHWRLRQDPRVTVMERTNVRDLQPAILPYLADVITADLSFISLALTIPALVRCAAKGADFVLLVKPQFEAGREHVGEGGVVSDPAEWLEVLRSVAAAASAAGLIVVAAMPSPLRGPAGNAEFFVHARRGTPGRPADLGAAVREAAAPVEADG